MRAKPLGKGFGHASRNSAGVTDGVRFPLRQAANGGVLEWVTNPRNVLFVDPALGAGVRVHAPLAVTTGSPFALTVEIDSTLQVTERVLGASREVARVSDVSAVDARVTALLVDHETRIAALERSWVKPFMMMGA